MSVTLCCVALVAWTQNDKQGDLTSLSLEDLLQVKVYTASRHLENSAKAPSAVSILTEEDIRHYGWRTLGEALRSLRGFYTAYDRDYVYLGVRGVLRPGDYNSRILLLINGHRLNDNVYDSAQLGTEFPLDIDLVERIEIVRGPSSSLFGSNAVFGVINVITRRPHTRTIEFSGQCGSFFGRTGRLTSSFQKGSFTSFVSGSLYRSNGHEQLYFTEFDSPEFNHGSAQNLDGDRSEQFFADLGIGNLRLQGLYSKRRKAIPTAPYHTNFNATGTTSQDIRGFFDISYHHALNSTTELDLRTYLDSYRSRGEGIYGDMEQVAAYQGVNTGDSDWSGVEAVVGKQIGQHRLTVGGQYEYSFQIAQQTYAVGGRSLVDESHTQSMFAFYSQAELKLSSQWQVNAGARLDWFDAFSASLSPRVALIYTPARKTTIKYVFGRAFRVPNAYESRYEDRIVVERASDPLEPEHITSHDIIFEQTLKPGLQIATEYFYNSLSKLIDLQPDPETGLSHFGNSGRSKGRGLEFQIEAKRPSGFSARASYTLADADDTLHDVQLANVPVQMGKLNFVVPVRQWVFPAMEMIYSTQQQTYGGTHVSPSFLTNFAIISGPWLRQWELSASCYNAFDRSWHSPAGPDLRQNSIQQDGRAFRIKIVYRLPLGERVSK